jgi:hypothetical protein
VALRGDWSARWVPTTGPGGLKAVYGATPERLLPRGQTFTASMWLYAPVGGFDVRVDLIFWGTGWLLREIETTGLVEMPSDEWVRLTVSGEVPANIVHTNYASVGVTNPSASPSHVLYIDEGEVGVHVYLGGLGAFVAEPERDDGDVDAGV